MATVGDERTFTSPIPPPKTRRKKYDVLRPKPNEPVRGICLHQEIIHVETHWHPYAGGKVRHLDQNCPWCEFFSPDEVRWYGYMPCWHDTLGKVVAVEITHQAALDCSAMSKQRIPLRGKELKVFRYGNSGHNRCGCTITDYSLKKDIPPPIDEDAFLEAIFEKCERVPSISTAPRYREEVHP